MSEMSLQKFLAECGIASRRKAEELIKQERVAVNGAKVSEMGVKVTETDVIEVDGKEVELESEKVYLMLNKPIGFVTTTKDQFSRKTVLDLIPEIKERVYPVGRLDYDTSGLLLLTNDGEFAYRLTHPKHEMDKVYLAEINGIPSEEDLERFEIGLKIEDYITAPAWIRVLDKKGKTSIIEISIHEGRNRQVKKMCDAIGHRVISLKRVAIGNLHLGDLEEGKWRHLNTSEIESFNF